MFFFNKYLAVEQNGERRRFEMSLALEMHLDVKRNINDADFLAFFEKVWLAGNIFCILDTVPFVADGKNVVGKSDSPLFFGQILACRLIKMSRNIICPLLPRP